MFFTILTISFMVWSEFYFVLRPSNLDGVGVFAAVDIETGTKVSDPQFQVRVLKKDMVPPIFHQYCIHKNDEEFFCPPRFDCMQIGWFINHSDKPNVIIERISHDGCSMNPAIMTLVTCKKIVAGDEILVNYNSLNEPEHLRETYYLS